jgi:hypothetical protein
MRRMCEVPAGTVLSLKVSESNRPNIKSTKGFATCSTLRSLFLCGIVVRRDGLHRPAACPMTRGTLLPVGEHRVCRTAKEWEQDGVEDRLMGRRVREVHRTR